MTLPDPAEGRATPHAGYHWAWVEEETEGYLAWQYVPRGPSQRLCRWMENRQQCGKASVARLMRSNRPVSNNWWHYCADHLYGRIVHEGRVWSACLVEDEPDA